MGNLQYNVTLRYLRTKFKSWEIHFCFNLRMRRTRTYICFLCKQVTINIPQVNIQWALFKKQKPNLANRYNQTAHKILKLTKCFQILQKKIRNCHRRCILYILSTFQTKMLPLKFLKTTTLNYPSILKLNKLLLNCTLLKIGYVIAVNPPWACLILHFLWIKIAPQKQFNRLFFFAQPKIPVYKKPSYFFAN